MPIVNLEQISKLLQLTPRQINKLAKEKGFPRVRRGQYDQTDCVHWYIAYIKKGTLDDQRDEQHSEEMRQLRAQSSLLEIKLAKERGEVIQVDDVSKVLEPAFGAIRSILLGIPKHAARELASTEIELFLDNHIRRCLNELSTIPDNLRSLAKPRHIEAAEGVRAAKAAPKAHRKRVGRSVPRAQQRSKRRKRAVGNVKG